MSTFNDQVFYLSGTWLVDKLPHHVHQEAGSHIYLSCVTSNSCFFNTHFVTPNNGDKTKV